MPLLFPIALLFACQLAGEIVARALGLPVPGPVLGMALLLTLLLLHPPVQEKIRSVADAVTANLSLLFVPAGVGVVGNLAVLSQDGAALAAILVVSTILGLLAGVGAFLLVLRLTGKGGAAGGEDGGPRA